MSTLALPVAIIEQINRLMMHFFWRKCGQDQSVLALIAWAKVCKAKNQDGLGILDISKHNKALMIKNLHSFLNNENFPWVNLIWESYYSAYLLRDSPVGSTWRKNYLKIMTVYKEHSYCTSGNGHSTLLWKDNWLDKPLVENFPKMYSLVKDEGQTAASWINFDDPSQFIHTPILEQAFAQHNELLVLLDLHMPAKK